MMADKVQSFCRNAVDGKLVGKTFAINGRYQLQLKGFSGGEVNSNAQCCTSYISDCTEVIDLSSEAASLGSLNIMNHSDLSSCSWSSFLCFQHKDGCAHAFSIVPVCSIEERQ